jgi:recombinational DNA repair ATPase RecF
MAQIKSSDSEDANKPKGILLIDDLSSELDESHIAIILHELSKMPAQIFISSTDGTIQEHIKNSGAKYALFHVKQGQIIAE